jgi:AcrR family transcriptional regulator
MPEPSPVGAPVLGLRERKKQRTRELIAEQARTLFTERGFERVTVADVARAADVSEQTVFNYFPTKEDLVYWRLESFEQELLDTIRERVPGESAFAAFARFVRQPRGMLGEYDAEARERLAALTRVIVDSPALLAREQRIFEGFTGSLAALLAAEEGADPGDVEPWVVANALMGVHRALVGYTRARIVAGARHPGLADEVLARADSALALLEPGLGGYAVKR